MKIIKDIVIPIIVASLAIFAVLITPGSFLVHPSFQIQVTRAGNSLEKVVVINNGWVQGKDVRISVISDAILTTTQTDCPEGIQKENDQSSVLTFQMDRMSSQLPCIITVKSYGNGINAVVVSALDSPAYEWTAENVRQLSYPIDYVNIVFGTVVFATMFIVVRYFISKSTK